MSEEGLLRLKHQQWRLAQARDRQILLHKEERYLHRSSKDKQGNLPRIGCVRLRLQRRDHSSRLHFSLRQEQDLRSHLLHLVAVVSFEGEVGLVVAVECLS